MSSMMELSEHGHFVLHYIPGITARQVDNLIRANDKLVLSEAGG
jgi:hypothetical protein